MQITGGFLKSRKIDSPKGENVRPTLSQIRESIFNVLFSMIDFEDKTFLDVFAGSGIMGFEAVSRGFESAVFIEKDKKTFLTLKENAKKLGLSTEQANFHIGDSTRILKKLSNGFDVIYADPPYQSGLYENILEIIAAKKLLSQNGIIALEHRKGFEIDIKNFEILKQKVYADKAITFLGFSN